MKSGVVLLLSQSVWFCAVPGSAHDQEVAHANGTGSFKTDRYRTVLSERQRVDSYAPITKRFIDEQ